MPVQVMGDAGAACIKAQRRWDGDGTIRCAFLCGHDDSTKRKGDVSANLHY